MRIAFAFAALLITGCLGPSASPESLVYQESDPPSAGTQTSTTQRPHPGTGPGSIEAPEWNVVSASFSGKAGEWVIFFQPMPWSITRAEGEWHATLETSAEGAYWSMGPDFIGKSPEGATLDAMNQVHVGRGPLKTSWEWQGYKEIQNGIGGLFFAMGAEVAWSASFSFRIGEGEVRGEGGVTMRGDGFRAVMGAGGPAVAGARALSLEATFEEPGWNHVAAITYSVQPIGVRELNLTFATGETWSSRGYSVGASHPMGSTQQGQDMASQHGLPFDVAGTVSATATTAQAAWETDLAIVHIPLQEPIPGLSQQIYHAHTR